jgi:hypothetical protein
LKYAPIFLCLLISGGTIADEPKLVPVPDKTPTPRVRVADELTQAKAVITDPNGQPLPEQMPLGEMVVFSFKRSIRGASPHSMKVIIEPPERAARSFFSDDMQTAFVPTGLKPVVISCTLIVAKGDIPDWTRISVRCGEGPIPPPGPDPIPPPDPPNTPPSDPTPDINGVFGLAPKVRDKASTVPPEHRGKAAALSGVYRVAALDVIEGKITVLNAASRLKALNSSVLTTEAERVAWKPFLDWLGTEMTALAASGKLLDAKDVVTALSEISYGLSLVVR